MGMGMQSDMLCRTIRQYSSAPIAEADMRKLLDIAEDYGKVKNYVYARFGGIGSLDRIYPGYTVQNEMTASGLRTSLGLPSVYFYLAVFDALGDIKCQWMRTKSKILELTGRNAGFSEDDKHYLRFLLKVINAFAAVLNQRPVQLPAEIQKQYEILAERADRERLHRYLCRQVRKYHVKLHTDCQDIFSTSERAYRYGNHGISLAVKEKRRRIFVSLTDNNQYKCQLSVRLYPGEQRLEIIVPVYVNVKRHEDYVNPIGIAMGMQTMLTTDSGHKYGENFGSYQAAYTRWTEKQSKNYHYNRQSNPGRKKYMAQKKCLEERLHGYINQELNRFLAEEKPGIIYLVKLPKAGAGGGKISRAVMMWQRGYIRRRLEWKCREHAIEIVEVFGNGVSRECSRCGGSGERKKGSFCCSVCGAVLDEKTNTAGNVRKRAESGKTVTKRQPFQAYESPE